jgi:hypothetical protein
LSNGNALGFFIALFQLLFLKPSDFFVPAFGDGGQRQNFRPFDLMLAGNFPGAEVGRQLQHLIADFQPLVMRHFAPSPTSEARC